MLTRLSCSVAQNKKPFRDDFRHPPPADLNILGYRVIPSLHHFVICKSNDVGLLFVRENKQRSLHPNQNTDSGYVNETY